MPHEPTERLQGTLDLLVLQVLARGPAHGWGISRRLNAASRDVFRVGQGSLYPALHRLEERGWVTAEWGVSEMGRRARFYRLTPAGRAQLARERMSWKAFVDAVTRVLKFA